MYMYLCTIYILMKKISAGSDLLLNISLTGIQSFKLDKSQAPRVSDLFTYDWSTDNDQFNIITASQNIFQ